MTSLAAPRFRESFVSRWGRRAVTIPAYLLSALIMLAATPALLLIAVLVDVFRPRRFVLTRSLLMVDVYLLAEAAGMLACLGIWVSAGGWRRRPSSAYLRRNFLLQCHWASFQLWGARRIFSLRIEAEGADDLATGPLIVIARHVSPVDNLVPAVFISARHGIQLRWVLNRWLLRDPCLDIVGGRLPNLFVEAGREEPKGQAQGVAALAEGLGPLDGVVIYPEGALFSPERRTRVIARLSGVDPGAAKKAAALRHVLAPRSGGFQAALAAVPDADVVVCSHSGLDSANSYRAFISGALVGARVRVHFRRVARRSIPSDPAGQAEWLWQAWADIDRWIAMEEAPTAKDDGARLAEARAGATAVGERQEPAAHPTEAIE